MAEYTVYCAVKLNPGCLAPGPTGPDLGTVAYTDDKAPYRGDLAEGRVCDYCAKNQPAPAPTISEGNVFLMGGSSYFVQAGQAYLLGAVTPVDKAVFDAAVTANTNPDGTLSPTAKII